MRKRRRGEKRGVGERWGEGGGVYSTIAPPPAPSLLLPSTPVGSEDSPQANLRVVRAAANQKAPSSPLACSPVVSSGCVATGKRLTSVAVWRDLTEERYCVRTPSLRPAINAHTTDTRRTHACNRLGEILDAHALDSART